jgi:hypothetical protein
VNLALQKKKILDEDEEAEIKQQNKTVNDTVFLDEQNH